MENLGFAADQISGHAGKRNREIVEALDFGVGSCNLIENQQDLLAGVKSSRELQSFAQAELQAVGIVPGIFLTAERKIVERSLSGHHLVPVNTVHHLPELGSIV